MFKKKEKRILEEINRAREDINNSKDSLDEIVKVYKDMQKDMIKAIILNQDELSLHTKIIIEVDDRLKLLEQKKVDNDVMFK